jgi:hypothetical protein
MSFDVLKYCFFLQADYKHDVVGMNLYGALGKVMTERIEKR